MRPIRVHSTKFNGSKHYRFESFVVSESADEIRVYNGPGVALDSYRGQLTSISHNLRIYWPDRFWNLSIRWRPDWSLEDYYVNIATPAKWTSEQIDWVDLDLDLILSPDSPEPLLDDQDEFERHAVKWKYPADLVQTCWATVEHVRHVMRRRESPFDDTIARWRPD
jgi:protein associated with RNAse G/E